MVPGRADIGVGGTSEAIGEDFYRELERKHGGKRDLDPKWPIVDPLGRGRGLAVERGKIARGNHERHRGQKHKNHECLGHVGVGLDPVDPFAPTQGDDPLARATNGVAWAENKEYSVIGGIFGEELVLSGDVGVPVAENGLSVGRGVEGCVEGGIFRASGKWVSERGGYTGEADESPTSEGVCREGVDGGV